LQTAEEESASNNKKKLLTGAVTADAIADLISFRTGIPVSKIGSDESKKLLKIEDELRKRVIGQDDALEAVSNAVRLARTRLQARDRTLGNFLFLGPTGVGKTELSKALAEYIFDNEKHMTRIDMSEFGEKHTVSKLIGAPPGYVGYEEGGILTESVRRRPYQVVLLDEFEKAHKDVWNLLLQLFDEGHLTDSQGRRVDFRNCIVIMTSNLGAASDENEEDVMRTVRHTLSPELLNRIDECLVFQRLQRENMNLIAKANLEEISKRLEETHNNMTLNVSDAALEILSDKGYDIRYGARPLKRTLAKEILNPLSKLILEGAVVDGDEVLVRSRGEVQNNEQRDTNNENRYNWGYLSSNPRSQDKNDVVIVRNHDPAAAAVVASGQNEEENDEL